MALHRCTLIAILPHMYPETLRSSLQRRPFSLHYKDQITGPISLTLVYFCLNVIDQELHAPSLAVFLSHTHTHTSGTQHRWRGIFNSELGWWMVEIRVEERGM